MDAAAQTLIKRLKIARLEMKRRAASSGWLLMMQTLESSFASYLYAVLTGHIWLLPPLSVPLPAPIFIPTLQAQGLVHGVAACTLCHLEWQ